MLFNWKLSCGHTCVAWTRFNMWVHRGKSIYKCTYSLLCIRNLVWDISNKLRYCDLFFTLISFSGGIILGSWSCQAFFIGLSLNICMYVCANEYACFYIFLHGIYSSVPTTEHVPKLDLWLYYDLSNVLLYILGSELHCTLSFSFCRKVHTMCID